MGKLGLNSGYIGSDQRLTTNGVVGYDKYYLERKAGRFLPVLETDLDTQAFFTRVAAAGGILSENEEFAVTQLVIQMKADGIWDKMKAIYPMVGASAAACAQNLKSSSFTGTFTAGWNFASTGATPNGTSAYMDTGLNANASLNINSTHISYYRNTTNTSGGGVLIGINDLSLFLQPVNSTFFGSLATTNFGQQSGDFNITGFFMVNRPSSTVQKLIRNSIIELSESKTSTGYASAQNVFLGNYTNSSQFATNSRCAFASIGDGLTDSEASNLYNSVQSFQTTLGRQVA